VLTEADARALSDAIRIAHDAGDRDQFAHLAIDAVETTVRSELTAYNEVDPPAARFSFVSRPAEADFEGASELLMRYAHHHPVIRYIQETGDGSAHKMSDFLDEQELRRNPLYEHVYSRNGAHWQMSITMPTVAPRIVAVVVSRTEGEADFDERDRLMLNLLRPHLGQSFEIARERERVRAVLGAVSDVLAAGGSHVVVLDEPPVEMTPGALDLVHAAFGPPTRRAPLPYRVSQWVERERARWRESQSGRSRELLQPLISERDGRRIAVRLVPGVELDSLVVREETRALAVAELEALGLSRREAEVLRLLARGDTNASIARAMRVEPSTVKTHLERIYRKLGVRGRVEAVATALDLTAFAPAP
jgi:DNA-binding CsgD family transcriptional regulator